MNNLPAQQLVPQTVKNWEDFIAYYQRLSEFSHNVSWHKADTLLALSQQFGYSSLEKFAKQIGEPRSTVVGYVRVARAFPPEKRIDVVPFTAHLAASYIDPYDEVTKEFTSEKRFQLLETAADEGLSTRAVNDKVQEDKIARQERGEVVMECDLCRTNTPPIFPFTFGSPYRNKKTIRKNLHDTCFDNLLEKVGGADGN
jgi:hypothetical protein